MNTRLLNQEIDRLIDDGETSYNSLSEIDKDNLTVLSMRLLGKNAYECITDVNDLDDTVNRLAKFIQTGSIENAIELADSMREQTTDYFSKNLSSLFDERLADMQVASNKGKGLQPMQHKDNGEITWIRA